MPSKPTLLALSGRDPCVAIAWLYSESFFAQQTALLVVARTPVYLRTTFNATVQF